MGKPGAIKNPSFTISFPLVSLRFSFYASREICLLLSSGLLGLDTAELGGRGILLRLLRTTNSANTSDSGFPQVGAISALGGAAGDALVDPVVEKSLVSKLEQYQC